MPALISCCMLGSWVTLCGVFWRRLLSFVGVNCWQDRRLPRNVDPVQEFRPVLFPGNLRQCRSSVAGPAWAEWAAVRSVLRWLPRALCAKLGTLTVTARFRPCGATPKALLRKGPPRTFRLEPNQREGRSFGSSRLQVG